MLIRVICGQAESSQLILKKMIDNPIEHFAEFDYFDSELLIFNYDKTNKQLILKCHYVLDRIHAVLTQGNTLDFDDLHTYIFYNVSAMRRKNVAVFLNKKNNVNTLAEQISINIDTIKIEARGVGFKITIAFLDGFGDAHFCCETVEYQRITS